MCSFRAKWSGLIWTRLPWRGHAQAFGSFMQPPCGQTKVDVRFEAKSGTAAVRECPLVYPKKSGLLEAPAHFRGRGSYGMNILFWDHPPQETTAGYLIERRAAQSPYSRRCSTHRCPSRAGWTPAVLPGVRYEYRLRSLDVDGHASGFSPILTLTPKALGESTLPVYALEIPEASLTHMLSNVNEDREVAGTFGFNGQRYPVQCRLRGQAHGRRRRRVTGLSLREPVLLGGPK